MAKARRNAAAMGAICAAVVWGTGPAAAETAVPPTIHLTVQNRCGVPDSVLERAQQAVAAIYSAIGVRVVWSTPLSDRRPDSRGVVSLRLVLVSPGSEHPVLAALPVAARVRGDVVGAALPAADSAYVFCGRVAARAARSGMNRMDVALARAIAHEVGHLVLPGTGHSEEGIMRSRLDLHAEQTAGFTDEQGASIRAFVTSRSAAR